MPRPASLARIVGSKWTSSSRLLGWRQFHVLRAQRTARGWEVELAASVDPTVRFWVSVAELRSRARFSPGWSTLAEMREGESKG